MWLDVDIIVLNPNAVKYFSHEKDVMMFGDGKAHCHIGLISCKRAGTPCMINWVAHNKHKIWNLQPNEPVTWGRIGGDFLEPYAYTHPNEVEILDWRIAHPEGQVELWSKGVGGKTAYEDYFFIESHEIAEIKKDLIILNNTWTPDFYKKLSVEELMRIDCTMTNVLFDALEIKIPPSLNRTRISRN